MELRSMCAEVTAAGGEHLSLVIPKGLRPRGFPRGELLCESSRGTRVYSFAVKKVLAFLDKAERG